MWRIPGADDHACWDDHNRDHNNNNNCEPAGSDDRLGNHGHDEYGNRYDLDDFDNNDGHHDHDHDSNDHRGCHHNSHDDGDHDRHELRSVIPDRLYPAATP